MIRAGSKPVIRLYVAFPVVESLVGTQTQKPLSTYCGGIPNGFPLHKVTRQSIYAFIPSKHYRLQDLPLTGLFHM